MDSDDTSDDVQENATLGTTVGVTAFSSDADTGDTITYSLDDDAGGRLTIDGNSGVVTVADGTLLNREAAASHDITVVANTAPQTAAGGGTDYADGVNQTVTIAAGATRSISPAPARVMPSSAARRDWSTPSERNHSVRARSKKFR